MSVISIDYKIPYRFVNNINDVENIDWIKSFQPDLICCFGWSSLLKEEILNTSRLGVVGFHPALLPFNRGRHPLIWALALGLKETGSTFFLMDKGADTGDIISQEKITISDEDDARMLYDKVTNKALQQLEVLIPSLADNTVKRHPQTIGEGNLWRKRSMPDGRIDFRMNSKWIINLVRALSKPYVGAHIELAGKDITIWKAKIGDIPPKNLEPGKVLDIQGKAIKVKCADGSVWFTEHEITELPQIGNYLI